MAIQIIRLDPAKRIRYISMRYKDNIGFDGIKLYGQDGIQFLMLEWNVRPSGSWTDLEEIPAGKSIIGLKMSRKMQRLGFSYWTPPPVAP